MNRNNSLRGILTLQSHTPSDVVAQLPVGERAAYQTGELELELYPLPVPADYAGVSGYQPTLDFFSNWFSPHYAGFDLMQGDPALFAERPQLVPLDLDVRQNKVLLMQYQDLSNVKVGLFASYTDPYTGAPFNTEKIETTYQARGYAVTVILEIEELDLP